MTASNLAICVGPSVLWSNDPAIMVDQSYSKHVSNVAQILIEEYFKIFGDTAPYIYQKMEAPEPMEEQDVIGADLGVGDGDEMMMVETDDTNVKMLVKGSGNAKSKHFILFYSY